MFDEFRKYFSKEIVETEITAMASIHYCLYYVIHISFILQVTYNYDKKYEWHLIVSTILYSSL